MRFEIAAQGAGTVLREPAFEATVGAVLRGATEALRAERGAFFEFLPDTQAVTFRHGVGWPAGWTPPAAVPLDEVLPRAASTDAGAPMVLPDIRAWPSAPAWWREHGLVSGLGVPVARDGVRHGFLAVYASTPRDFTAEDIRWLQAMGGLVSEAATRARRDEALHESEARLSGIIASAMDAIITVDDEQRIVLFNRAAESTFRCAAGDAIGKPLETFIPARLREAHREHLRSFAESGATVRRMGRIDPLSALRADGEEFPIEASISHAEVGGKRVFTVILRDISEKRQLEEQLLHLQKLESVGRLAGGLAHDFNNVLTALFGYLDLARRHADAGGRMSECLDAMETAAHRGAELTGKLLAFARKQLIEPKVIDLNQLIRSVVGMASRVLGDHIEIVVHTAPLLPTVRVDPGQFEQVLVNLAVNARDAMPKGGKFIIETSSIELDDEYTRLRPEVRPGPHVQLAVSDTGVGMDSVTLEHCFEPFFTTKASGRGTGLGLASCYGIVKQSGGHIFAYSERGRGTTFRILLPVCRDAAQAAPTPMPAIHAANGYAGTILLVEDDPLVRGIAARTLRDCGYTVLEAADGGEALTRATRTKETIGLLLTDIVLPKLPGNELAERMRELRPHIRVLYTSGFTDKMIAHQGILPPGVTFLAKPYTPSALADKVRHVLEDAPNAPA